MSESKCSCQHCRGHLAFPSEMDGQSVPCPHCGRITLLLTPLPPIAQVRAIPQADAPAGAIPEPTLIACQVVSLLIPVAGIAIGVWLLTKNQVSQAAACLGLAIAGILLCLLMLGDL